MSKVSIRIVLIEDNQADVYLIEQALRDRRFEFELVHYASGDEALQHFCPEPGMPLDPPDLILLDLHLPGTEGHEVLRAIRDEPRLKGVPVAILSGADPQRLRRTDLTGSNLVIHKSMELEKYMSAVGDAVLQLFPRREWIVPQAGGAEPRSLGGSPRRTGPERRNSGGTPRTRKTRKRGRGTSSGAE